MVVLTILINNPAVTIHSIARSICWLTYICAVVSLVLIVWGVRMQRPGGLVSM
jgi:hypothetical protein